MFWTKISNPGLPEHTNHVGGLLPAQGACGLAKAADLLRAVLADAEVAARDHRVGAGHVEADHALLHCGGGATGRLRRKLRRRLVHLAAGTNTRWTTRPAASALLAHGAPGAVDSSRPGGARGAGGGASGS